MKRLPVVMLLASTLFLAACATQQYYAAAVNSWQGASEKQVYHVWGYPNKTRKMDNGHRLLIYNFHERGRNPVYQTSGTTTVEQGRRGRTRVTTTGPSYSGGGTYNLRCTTFFELNKNKRVVNTSFRGNDCVATKQYMMMHTYQGF